ncbi:glyoxalase [Flavobacterium sp. TMP13]|uniref:glyoxalase n=1 Tax=unclassified Flavobacterium TaxID=196869 RepID=UPI00076D7B52|nr:glyoxalase [Flavobacterium sp. TAB 87]KVV14698.1 hypothetical protein AP058_01751 [Flavobacterium sp. TAB 87]
MANRDSFLKEFRGEVLGTTSSQSSPDEVFQNQVLRPILKLQNDLLISVFVYYVQKNKVDFFTFSVDKKLHAIENSIQKDIKFRNTLKGIVIGLFSLEEYQNYIQNSSSLNKRMMTLIIERLRSQVQLLEIQPN